MAIGVLSNAISGLAAFQRSLEVTSNNIANVNTEGYSRQRVELQTMPEQFVGQGYLGNGVNATNIKRSYDEFLTGQLRSSMTAYNDVDSFYVLSSQIDNALADEATGLAPAMKTFFNAVNDVASDPTSLPARQMMLEQANSMTQMFHTLSTRFEEARQQVSSNLDNAIKDVNSYAKSIADMNLKIADAIGKTSGQQLPNELMDQRDVLLNKIAEKMDVSAVEQPDGTVSVFMGQGQPLVLGGNYNSLGIQSSGADSYYTQIMLNGQDITNKLTGGEVYGNLRFRDDILDPAQAQLGLLATGMAVEFNNVHKAGYDLNGTTGVDFFTLGSSVKALVRSTVKDSAVDATATFVTPTSAANLGASYRVDVTGTGPATFTLTNLTNTSIAPVTGLTAATLATTAATNGFSLSFADATKLTAGDSFEIKPNFNIAAEIKVNSLVKTPADIAAASAAGQVGDNGNALKLAKLESASTMLGGKKSFTQVYGEMVAEVGSKTYTASVSRSAQKVLLNQATQARDDISGVNLDEEAANLIKFQNAYQAAAKAASVANNLFDTLLSSVN